MLLFLIVFGPGMFVCWHYFRNRETWGHALIGMILGVVTSYGVIYVLGNYVHASFIAEINRELGLGELGEQVAAEITNAIYGITFKYTVATIAAGAIGLKLKKTQLMSPKKGLSKPKATKVWILAVIFFVVGFAAINAVFVNSTAYLDDEYGYVPVHQCISVEAEVCALVGSEARYLVKEVSLTSGEWRYLDPSQKQEAFESRIEYLWKARTLAAFYGGLIGLASVTCTFFFYILYCALAAIYRRAMLYAEVSRAELEVRKALANAKIKQGEIDAAKDSAQLPEKNQK